jgi:hypothetical protein
LRSGCLFEWPALGEALGNASLVFRSDLGRNLCRALALYGVGVDKSFSSQFREFVVLVKFLHWTNIWDMSQNPLSSLGFLLQIAGLLIFLLVATEFCLNESEELILQPRGEVHFSVSAFFLALA